MSCEQKNEIEKTKTIFLEEIDVVQSQEYLKNRVDAYAGTKEYRWK